MKKKIRKELRKLSEKVYQIQLDEELSKLANNFNDWQNKRIDGFELSDRIHEFHDGSARELWKRYNYSRNDFHSVAIAIVGGQLPESEISEDAMSELKSTIEFYKHQFSK